MATLEIKNETTEKEQVMAKRIIKADANTCYKLLNDARLGNISDAAKLDVLRVLRALRPIAKELEEEHIAALGKLKPDGYDERLHAAQLYEAAQKDGKTAAITATEYIDIINEIRRYDAIIRENDATLLNGEVEVELPCLDENVLIELMTTNGWTAGQMMAVEDIAGKE